MKKIIHIDFDSYYAAIEARDNPELQGLPIAIGGSRYKRGVLSTCSYEARKFGVRSAMPTARALQLCPELIVIPGRMDIYKAVSAQAHDIFSRYTDIIEPLSLDEAYLDVTNSSLFQGSATLIAQDIRKTIWNELNLTVSAGVAPLKFLAKVASDVNKPNGICVISPAEVGTFIDALPLEKISGVGQVTLEKLHKLGLCTGRDIRNSERRVLLNSLGKFGQTLWDRCHGIDKRDVEPSRERKSMGVERTFEQDIFSEAECLDVIARLFPLLMKRVGRVSEGKRVVRQGVKLKFSDFKQTTVEHKHASLDEAYFHVLLKEALTRQNGRGIRLIGISVGLRSEGDETNQMSFKWQ